MTTRETEEAGPSGTLRLVVLVLAALAAWLAVREAVQHEFAATNPGLAAKFWPASGVGLATEARQRIAANDGNVDPQSRAMAAAALRRDPLLAEPVMIAGLAASADGDTGKAEALMEAARHRDPRSAIVRFWLFDHYLRIGDFAKGLDEAGPAMRLRPETDGAIMAVMTALANTPTARPALRDKLAERPFWRTLFFQSSMQSSADPQQMLALLEELPRNPDREAATAEQRATLLGVVGRGDYDLAYRAWLAMLPASYRERAGGVYDGNFAGWPGAVPFNWSLQNDGNGVAKMVKAPDLAEASALDVRYFGSNQAVLAEQYVIASPGPYRLQLRIRRRTEGAVGGQFAMQARCGDGTLIGTLPLDNLRPTMETRAIDLVVPPGCPAVRLRLTADPGDVFSETEAQLSGVSLKRL